MILCAFLIWKPIIQFDYVFQPSSPMDEIVDKLQEAVVAAASGDDPVALKQKLLEETAAAATSAIQDSI